MEKLLDKLGYARIQLSSFSKDLGALSKAFRLTGNEIHADHLLSLSKKIRRVEEELNKLCGEK